MKLRLASNPQPLLAACMLTPRWRQIRSLKLRLEEQGRIGESLAAWLEQQGDVVHEVAHPSLASHPHHDRWQRTYSGSGPTFGFRIQPGEAAMSAFMDGFRVIAIGNAQGGEFSCAWPHSVEVGGPEDGWVVLYVGLESDEEVRRDLEEGLQRLRDL